MNDADRVQNLLELRKWAIEQYSKLDRVQPTAQMTHKEIALILKHLSRA